MGIYRIQVLRIKQYYKNFAATNPPEGSTTFTSSHNRTVREEWEADPRKSDSVC